MRRLRMRRRALDTAALLAIGSTIAAAAAASCADSEAPRFDPVEDSGPPDSAIPDAGSQSDADADADARSGDGTDACSAAGWCATDTDPRLSFDDLWPLEHSAVTVASREGRSSVLLYEASSWVLIHEVPFLLASVWAASAEDVWVSGAGGYLGHGRRNGTGWTWIAHPLPVSTAVSVVWGTGASDIYALADARVWRLSLDENGMPDTRGWSVDYGDVAGPTPATTLTALVGRNADDIWVTGQRGMFPGCGLVAHKTGGAWVNVVDGTVVGSTCEALDGSTAFGAPLGKAAATGTGELVALADMNFTSPTSFVRLRHQAGGDVEIASAPRSTNVTSIWGTSTDDLYATRFSVVERGREIWADAGSWQISTVAFDGIPIGRRFNVVRGTRSDDIWLAGESYVFHKSSP